MIITHGKKQAGRKNLMMVFMSSLLSLILKRALFRCIAKLTLIFFFTHGVFDLSRAGDYARAKFIAGLYICEYESRLDELVGKFKLSKPPSIEDYEFPL